MVASLLLLLGLGACRGHSDARRPPDVLLITLDTVRADALGVYGASPSPTPTIDALGARGVVVDEAMTVAPLTLPAHASILTGTYPTRTGIRDNMSFRLGDEAVTLAERLADIGYDTGAFVSAAVLDRAFGLGQGFHRYDDDVHAAGLLGIPRRPAGEGVTAAASWIASLPAEKPTFTWLHLYDAHLPLTPPADVLARFPGDGYTASIAYADAQVGLLLERYRSLGRDPIVVIVADHGEGRGDHGEQTHGWFVYRSTMRVPLVMHGPGVPEGVRWAGTASVVDIVPTVLDLLGQAPPEGVDGVSLLPELRGGGPAAGRVVFGESWSPRYGFGFSELRVAQNSAFRLIHAPEPELYGWRVDPREVRNVIGVTQHDPLQAALDDYIAAEGARAPTEALDPSLAAALEALGYVASVPDHVATQLPDPKTAPDMIQRYDEVMIEARTRSPADGMVVLESFLAQHPGVAPARLLVGRAALLSGQWDRGLAALAPVVARSAQARLLSAQIRLAAGRDQDAARDLQALKEGWPAWSAPYAVAAAVRRDRGDCAGAIAEASAGLAAVPDAVDLLVERGVCLGAQGDLGAAARDLRAALKSDPGHADLRFELAVVLARDGHAAEALPLLLEQVARQPQHVEARAALGVAQYELGRLDDAVATLDDVVDEERSGAEAPLVLADALLSLGRDLDRALLLLERAERRAPSEVQVHAVRARVLAALGRMEEARAEAGVYREQAQAAR